MAAVSEDVAEMARVSTASASRALRGPDAVSARTRECVLASARELGYVSSPAVGAVTSRLPSRITAAGPLRGTANSCRILMRLRHEHAGGRAMNSPDALASGWRGGRSAPRTGTTANAGPGMSAGAGPSPDAGGEWPWVPE